jgi:hypothetical protein
MTDKKKPEPKPQSGASSTRGQSVRPSSKPPSATERKEGLVQEIPIGVPVSPEEYRRLKAQAEQARAEQASQAQQDAPADA